MSEYKLSASLEGHGDDVRAVAFLNSKVVSTASRDATVRIWKQISSPPPTYDCTIASHGSGFINSLAYYPPTSEYPEGLIFSGSQDTIIDARQPSKASDDNADAMLLGHGHNVCSIDVCSEGEWIVSGSWDATARLWRVGNWATEVVFDGHQGSVWAVLAYDKYTVITGCADRIIRIFNTSGKLLKSIKDSQDVVRALTKLPSGHPSGAQFASASNDGVIRLFTLDGELVSELHGHESFIYSLAVLPSGELVSSGEDRTVKVWNGNQCIQTITHPAISVWDVAVCRENGDIITGASDRIARIFSRDQSRQAEPAVIQQFESAVKESAIPQQQVGNINKEKLPGPDFLKQKSGTKDGQVQMIKEDNGSVTAHTWSSATQEWIAVGTVVESAGSSGRKTQYLGQDYDYVFDVDIEDGKPPLKLPFNLSQNPYEVATKFIQDNELPISYLEQVANFITQNTQGATLGQTTESQQAAGADPWGQERRYRPGDAAATPQAPPPSSISETRPSVLPQKSYLSIKSANIKVISKKLQELNEQLVSSGNKDVSFNPPELEAVLVLCNELESKGILPKEAATTEPGIQSVIKAVTKWPAASRLPALDLLRLLAAATPVTAQTLYEGRDVITAIQHSGVFENPVNGNNAMLAIRLFGNLFETSLGRELAIRKFDDLLRMVSSVTTSSSSAPNRNITIAATTLYINYAVYFTTEGRAESADSAEHALQLLDELSKIFAKEKDSEAVYRGLVAVGTLISELGEEVKSAAKDIYSLNSVLGKLLSSGSGREPRVKGVVEEIRKTLS
ncbi:putative polyubiquitin binding protein [Talaromyces proteolyticus]|uniref:Polyubiquitin binding protein n=1 Tax=Talaromyces proteolyticus TaxID=1131652 RepID=A0AAD4Q115_9EURO|nr:putative polyubiquitin binding protein [Talaromyces proteolyticus]KAH8701794.1 putative polyubiquitin binding protein [Talaromyces proteolyticus]